jgi:protein-serine/threonine kinase
MTSLASRPASPSSESAYRSSDSPPLPTPPSSSSSGTLSSKWKTVFKMGKSNSNLKGKERSASGVDVVEEGGKNGLSSSTSSNTSTTITNPGPRPQAERSFTEPLSYFPPVQVQNQHDPIHNNDVGHVQTNRDLTGLGALRDGQGRKDSFPTATTSTSLSNSNENGSSGEQARKYSNSQSVTAITDRSSHSSSSQINGHLAGLSQHSSGGRSPGSAFGGFKARFFSNPAKAGSRDKSPTRMQGKQDKYKGLGIGTSRDQSIGSSSLSPSESNDKTSGTIPRTPNRNKLIPPPSPLESKDITPSKGSAATRWLRRVVSAPNTKALLSQSTYIPPVPPVPSSAVPSSPVIVITSQDKPMESPTGGLGLEDGNGNGIESPTKSRNTPSPHKPSITSSLNPNPTGVRGQRAATISSGAKTKDIQAQLGLGVAGESHHKQVFRRTYSSNSIKTRSVRSP